MGTWISKDGVMTPAQEEVALVDKDGKPYIYKGPDRSATEYLKEQGATHLGVHFSKDPEFINRVRQVHSMTMKEYMEANGYDENTTNEEFQKAMSTPIVHADPPRKRGRPFASGGRNTAGNSGHMEGGMGDPPKV